MPSGALFLLAAGENYTLFATRGGVAVVLRGVLWPSTGRGDFFFVLFRPRIKPAVGDVLVSNLRRPLLRLIADESPGVHCMLFAACDRARYELLGCTEYHDNCADNLRAAIAEHGIPLPYVPTPLNLFMNTKFYDHTTMVIEPPQAKPGDSVTFRAEHDCTIVLSACPQDLLPVNAHDCTPKAVAYQIS